jgi:hypothetical protein
MCWILTPSLSARYLGLSLGNSSFLGQGLWGLIGQGWCTLGLGVGGVPLVLVYRGVLLEGLGLGKYFENVVSDWLGFPGLIFVEVCF